MKLIFILLVIVFITSVYAIPAYYVISHSDHHCLDADCETCLNLSAIIKIINKISRIVVACSFIISFSIIPIIFIKYNIIFYNNNITPIKLKVKLIN